MGALAASAVRIRHDLHTRLVNARARTDELFQLVREEALYDRPIAERHRIIFYIGHVEAFDWNLLSQRAFGLRSFHRTFDHLFAFGIDPVGGGLPTDAPEDWPTRQEIQRYNNRAREELDHAIEYALGRPDEQVAPGDVIDIIEARGRDRFVAEANLRPTAELLDAADLLYRYHWAVRDAKFRGSAPLPTLNPDVVVEWHYALNWLIGYNQLEWDEMSTDT